MRIVISTNGQDADFRIGDIFEVVAVDGEHVALELQFRPKEPAEPPALGIRVADGIGIGDRMA